jgi:hypothetical protein
MIGSGPARDLALPRRRGLQHGGDDGGRGAHHRDAVPLHPPQDLRAVDLADHDLGDAEAGKDERHAPPVRVEHRQRVQVDVAVGDRRVQGEDHAVDPHVAVGDLHALRPRRRAAGVVDRRGGVLVRLLPRHRLGVRHEQRPVDSCPST